MHPTKRNALAIDPDSAQIVQRIFEAAVAGSNTSAIAQMLNDEDIPTPGQYFQSKNGNTKKFNYMSEKISWDVAMVLRVLKKSGLHRRSGQSQTEKLRCWQQENCPAGTHRCRGTHEAIISKETFLLAQRVIRRGNHEPRKVSDYPLRGLVCCGNCKRTMTRRKRKDGSVFTLAITLTTTGIQSAVLEKSTAKAVWKILFTMRLAISWPLQKNRLFRTEKLETSAKPLSRIALQN